MIGDTAEYDVFLSYRVNSDLETAAFLYDTMTQKGLKVWWDKTCLLPGVPWEVGFTDGLLKSRIFLPIFSRGFVNYIQTEALMNSVFTRILSYAELSTRLQRGIRTLQCWVQTPNATVCCWK